ncbi:MAG: RHS repeat-associated core domain-containing protein, partial [Terriglobia bacterium]
MLSSTQYTPYGFDATGSGPGYRSFTGQKQDIDSSHTGGQYDFLLREYNPIQGRWWTPDPAGPAAVDPNNPQTWNRYAYVGGTPLTAVDPFGLYAADDSDPTTT